MKVNAVKFQNIKNMSREDWLKCRQKGIGGSDVSAILGLNKYSSPLKVYMDKVEVIEGPEEIENDFMHFGNVLEDIVAREFGQRTGFKVQRSSFMWQHPEHKFMLANVDRLIYDPDHGWGVLECKTASEYRKEDFDGDVIPEEYLLQVLHYLYVMDLQFGYLAVLIGGNKFKYFRVDRDEEVINMIVELEKNFWNNHVIPRVPPEIDGSEASSKLLEAMYPADQVKKDEKVDLPDEAAVLIKQYEDAAKLEADFKAAKETAANKLKGMIGDNQKGVIYDREIKWTPFKGRKSVDVKRLDMEHPEIVEKYIKYGKPGRRFMIV